MYVGNGEVIHFSAGNLNPAEADIKRTTLAEFEKDGEARLDNQEAACFSKDEIVKRAEALLGTQQGKYDLALNNCEHFAKWCKTGKKVSDQVEAVKETVPSGEEILETYSNLKTAKKTLAELFSANKVQKEQTYAKIKKRTKELLDDYDNRESGTTAEDWISKTFDTLNPIKTTAESVNDYINDVKNELSINDAYREDLAQSVKKGMPVSVWFMKNTEKTIGRNAGELYLNQAQADIFRGIESDSAEHTAETGVPAKQGFWESLDTKDQSQKQNAKIVLATGLKISGETFLHCEIPTSVTVPVASAAVEIGCAVKECAAGEISTAKCIGKVASEVAIAGVHIIQRSAVNVKEIALHSVSQAASHITKRIAGGTIKQASATAKREMKSAFGVAAKSCAAKVAKVVSGGVKAAVRGFAKAFGGKR